MAATKRRGRGEGSVSQRADGRWEARVCLGWKEGKRRFKSFYGQTAREVQGKLRTAITDVEKGLPLANERQTTAEYLRAWLSHVETRLRPRAYATYVQAIELHVTPGVGTVPLAKLTPQHLQAWFTQHQKDGASARTIRYARAVLRAALNQALRWSLVARNAAALVEPPRHVARQIQPLTPEQARTLLTTTTNHRLGPLVSVALALGLRIGEALALRWDDVDLETKIVRVTQALERSGGDSRTRKRLRTERRNLMKEIRETPRKERAPLREQLAKLRTALKTVGTVTKFTEPKSVRSRRTVTIPDVLLARLKQHRKAQLQERLIAGKHWQDSRLVFTTPIGTALDARNVHRAYKAMLSTAELPNIRLHDLRHTAATLMLAQGVDPRTIMETLGHSQISLTMNTYSHVVPALQAEAAAKMNAALTGNA